MVAFYEKEEFVRDPVPIRLFYHSYTDDHVFTPIHWHQSVEITLILAGETVHCIDGNNIICGPNDFCIVNSGVIHSNHTIEIQPEIRGITLQISIAFIESWLGKDVIFCIPQDTSEQMQIRDLILKIAEESRCQDEFHNLRQMELTLRLLVTLSRSCVKKDKDTPQGAGDFQRFKELLDYIEKHYQEQLSLDALADRFGYSPAYLSRSFKKHVGYNFSRHVQMIRMNAVVADMREHSDKSILNCATDHGFPNVKSFIHTFKQEYGCTPSQWRKKK